jgi:WXXGXW repeat (2 copies)
MYRLLHSNKAILVLTAGLCACTVVPSQVDVQPPAVVVEAPMPPPPPLVEVIPVAPGAGYFWINGYWRWTGREHQWEPGHWELHRERSYWVPHRWDRDDRGHWRLHEGYWRAD